MDKHEIIATIRVAFVLQCIMCSAAFGVALLTASVELDGQVVLRTSYAEHTSRDGATVWRFWGKEPKYGDVLHPFPASEIDPLRATLSGSLYLKIEDSWGIIVDGHAHDLTLRRTHTGSKLWFLPSREVERIAELSGIPPAPLDYEALLGWSCLCIIAVGVGSLITAAVWRAKREQACQAVTREEHDHTH